MSKITVYKIERVATETQVDADDLIAISDASRLRDVSVAAIANAMTMGDLPELFKVNPHELPDSVRAQRFTSRKAVEALPKVKGDKVKNTLRKVYSSENSPYPRIKLALTSIFAPRRAFALQ